MKEAVRKFLDAMVSYLFLIGFFASKLKDIPIAIVTLILSGISLAAYMVGYFLWFFAALLYPDQPRRKDFWWGFAQFKEQYQFASLLGAIACIMVLVAPAIFLVPALWIFTVSNLMWSFAEHHKIYNPPINAPDFSRERQALFFRYVALMTAVCLITTICITLAFFFPPLSFLAFILPVTIGNIITIGAFYYCGQCLFGEFKPDHSYVQLANHLAFDLVKEPANIDHENENAMIYNPLFQQAPDNGAEPKDDLIQALSSVQLLP
jgi:hypothetical protein